MGIVTSASRKTRKSPAAWSAPRFLAAEMLRPEELTMVRGRRSWNDLATDAVLSCDAASTTMTSKSLST